MYFLFFLFCICMYTMYKPFSQIIILYIQIFLYINSPVSVTLTCIKPMWVPMRAGSFSREKALYGAMMVACATCHAEPRRVTASGARVEVYVLKKAGAAQSSGVYSLSMTRPTKRLSVTVENVVNFCEFEIEMQIITRC